MNRVRAVRFIAVLALAGGISTQASAAEPWEAYLDQVRIKKAIADQLTPEQLEQRRVRLAKWLAERAAAPAPIIKTGADACPASTFEIGTLPFGPVADTTVGRVDDYDLPPDTAAPTCEAPTTCTGAGPAGSLPRGAIYTGTGTAPDFAYKIRTSTSCTLNITMDPTGAEDLSLIAYQNQCTSALADCACVDDTGVGGVAETVLLDAIGGTDYFVVVDGYSTGGTPPGPSGAFTVQISEVTATGCTLVGDLAADLTLDITDAPDPVNAGDDITYTLTSSNGGTAAASDVTITTATPTDTVFVSADTTSAGSCTGPAVGGTGAVVCTFDDPTAAAASQSATLIVTVDPAVVAAAIITADASTATSSMESDGGNNTASATTTVTTSADMAVTLVATPEPVAAGGSLTYDSTLTNNGPSNATLVTYALPLPAGTVFASAVTDPALTCLTPAVGSGGSVTCTAASVDAGASHDVDVVVDVDVGTTGPLTATATVGAADADPNAMNNTAEATSTVVTQTELSITIDNGQDGVIDGEEVIYQVQVDNAGPSNAVGASVDVMLSANLTAVEWTCAPSPTGNCPNAAGTGNIAETVDLDVSDGLRYEVIATVAAGVGDISVTGTASVEAPVGATEQDTSDNSDTDTDSILPIGIFSDGFED